PLAVLRAAWSNTRRRKLASGGSTITMQLARLTLGLTPGPLTFRRKIREMWLALLIERHHTKEEILAAYLNAVPSGPQRWGLATAARDWLSRSPDRLSPAEAAYLAALPKHPLLDGAKLRSRQKWILGRLKSSGWLDESSYQRALTEEIFLPAAKRPFEAPHFLTFLQSGASLAPEEFRRPRVLTSLDLEIQKEAERLVRQTVSGWEGSGLSQAAAVIMSLPDREVLAWVGSADFADPEEGQIDGVLALRQPGSALKPFIYQLALSRGEIAASSRLSDRPVNFSSPAGSFAPQNYSRTYHGLVSARTALASSLNIPAIELIDRLTVPRVLEHLRSLGLVSLTEGSDHYGLGLALGNGEVSLLALTNAYAILAQGGLNGRPVFEKGRREPPGPRVMDAPSAWLAADILADDEARISGFGAGGVLEAPYPVSVKTGTSQNYRDNWCLGFTDKYVIGVWAGNFQAQPMNHVSGVDGAGYLWRELSDYLARKFPPEPRLKPLGLRLETVCPISGLPLGPDCPNGQEEYFLEKYPLPEQCDHGAMDQILAPGRPLQLLTPQSQEVYALDPGLEAAYQNLPAVVRLKPGLDETVWLYDGREMFRDLKPGTSGQHFFPLAAGRHRLEVLALKDNQILARSEASFTVK
ncbi:MAG: transglycosylase domain-containing protein, partial [Deltaproteobacteria bacterium]|nr:transglycosylase domain-containing protein [Deltaproteobacteria bacterium]